MILVTGGAGFIGSHIARRALSLGQRVRVLDNFSSGREENLVGLEGQIEVLRADLLDSAALANAMNGVEVVFHQAALRSVPFSIDHPSMVNRVNVEGTLNVLIAARDAGVRRVIYASSSSVYGNEATLPKNEQQLPRPISPYAVSKLTGEYYCRVFCELYGVETVSLRYFNVFGPRQDPNSQYAAVIPLFIGRAIQRQPLEVHGDGLQSRDFTYIDNVVDANFLAAESTEADGKAFNVGQNTAHTLLDVIELLQKRLGMELQLVHTPNRAGDVRHTLADISLAQRYLGYKPLVSFEEGLSRTAGYFTEQIRNSPAAAPAVDKLRTS